MITAGFLRQKIEKIYEHTVEECTELHISEYLAYLYEQASYSSPPHLRPPPVYPELKLIEGRAGIFIRTFFECPGCGRRRSSLFLKPDDPDIFNYRCRVCIGLPYSSQRYSRGHPLRAINTFQKRRTKIKKIMQGRSAKKRPRKNQIASWDDPALFDQARGFLPTIDGLAEEAFSRILEIAESGKNKKMREKAKKMLRKCVSKLKKIEKAEAHKIVMIR